MPGVRLLREAGGNCSVVRCLGINMDTLGFPKSSVYLYSARSCFFRHIEWNVLTGKRNIQYIREITRGSVFCNIAFGIRARNNSSEREMVHLTKGLPCISC